MIEDLLESIGSPGNHDSWRNGMLYVGPQGYVRPADILLDMMAHYFGEDDGSGTVVERGRLGRTTSFGKGTEDKITMGSVARGLRLNDGLELQDLRKIIKQSTGTPRIRGEETNYPISPGFCNYGWLRKNAAKPHLILLEPAIKAGKAWDSGLDPRGKFVKALGSGKDDILNVMFDMLNKSLGEKDLQEVTSVKDYENPVLSRQDWRFTEKVNEPLTPPERLCKDMVELAKYEDKMSRFEWIKWASGILRCYLPLISLWTLRANHEAWKLCEQALKGVVVDKKDIHDKLLNIKESNGEFKPNDAILTARDSWERQIHGVVKAYAVARTKICTLLTLSTILDEIGTSGSGIKDDKIKAALEKAAKGKGLSMPGSGEGYPFDKFLKKVHSRSSEYDTLAKRFGYSDWKDLMRKVVETKKAYHRVKGNKITRQTNEFIRYSLRSPRVGVKDHFALIDTFPGGSQEYTQTEKIRPGKDLLKMLVQIVTPPESERNPTLRDLRNLFRCLGVTFRDEEGGTKYLYDTLKKMELLEGSTDAQLAVEISRPYGGLT